MTALNLDEIRTMAVVIFLALGSAIGILWTVRTGFFTLQSRTVSTLKEAVAALELKVEQLEERLAEYEIRNKELEGQVEGKERIIADIIESITESGLCGSAWECKNRIIPVDHVTTRHTSGRRRTNGDAT